MCNIKASTVLQVLPPETTLNRNPHLLPRRHEPPISCQGHESLWCQDSSDLGHFPCQRIRSSSLQLFGKYILALGYIIVNLFWDVSRKNLMLSPSHMHKPRERLTNPENCRTVLALPAQTPHGLFQEPSTLNSRIVWSTCRWRVAATLSGVVPGFTLLIQSLQRVSYGLRGRSEFHGLPATIIPRRDKHGGAANLPLHDTPAALGARQQSHTIVTPKMLHTSTFLIRAGKDGRKTTTHGQSRRALLLDP